MSDRPGPDRLTELISQADRSLRSYLRPAGFRVPSLTPAKRSAERTGWLLEALMTASSVSAQGPSGRVSGTSHPSGGTMFPDNERSLRALAKEIKRLIGEDKRRGLDV